MLWSTELRRAELRQRGGPGGNRTPCVGRRLVYSQLRPMARTDPCRGQVALAAATMSLQLSRNVRPHWRYGARAGSEGVEPRPSVLETATPPLARALGERHAVVRGADERCGGGGRATSARRGCRLRQAPVVPAWPHHRGSRACTRTRPKLVRGCPWSLGSAVWMRAIGLRLCASRPRLSTEFAHDPSAAGDEELGAFGWGGVVARSRASPRGGGRGAGRWCGRAPRGARSARSRRRVELVEHGVEVGEGGDEAGPLRSSPPTG